MWIAKYLVAALALAVLAWILFWPVSAPARYIGLIVFFLLAFLATRWDMLLARWRSRKH